MKLTELEHRLLDYGLYLRGVSKLSDEETESLQIEADKNLSIALVGNTGSSYWPVFSRSSEFQDGKPDPLDRWSQRIAEKVAKEFGLSPIYPFEGPPYYPFLQWAQRAEALHQSPLGLMIHAQYGLWHSYRFGLLIAQSHLTDRQNFSVESPCQKCRAQPCLHSCPVDAFSTKGYDVDLCAAYLKETPDARCHQEGCLARLACPVGEVYRYEAAQHTFHLRSFIAAR